MKVTPDILRYEFIGANALVATSPNMNLMGASGLVVAETRNTFTLQNRGIKRSIIKEAATFDFTFNDGTVVEIDVKLLVGRSEDRLKKSVKRLW